MKLLILTNNPKRASYRQRIGNYLDILKDAGIEPTVMVLEKSILRRVRQYRHVDDYDVVLLHKKCLNFLEGLFFCPQKAGVIFNYDDAVMFNDKGRETGTHRNRFKRSLQRADKVLVGSSYLARQASPYHNDIVVLPLGLNTADYRPDIPKPNDGKIRLVWIGSAATLDYIHPLVPVIQKLAQRYPALILRLICDEFVDIEGVTVEKIKWTPEMRFRGLAESDIGLAPLPDTPFTRGKCSFKVLEYSASGLPVVASPVGTNPDHVKDGRTGYLVNTNREWFDKISELVQNQTVRYEMGQRGKAYAAEFDVSVVGKKLCDLILQMAS